MIRTDIHTLCWMALALLLGASCSDEPVPEPAGTAEHITLKIRPAAETVVSTRAASEPAGAERVNTLDFLAYDAATGLLAVHQQFAPQWTGAEYQVTMPIRQAEGAYTVYLVANRSLAESDIASLDALRALRDYTWPAGAGPFTLSTNAFTVEPLNAGTLQGAMKKDGGAFRLLRNVAKFTVESTAANFTVTEVKWVCCNKSGPVLPDTSVPAAGNGELTAASGEAVYMYQGSLPDSHTQAHTHLHALVTGNYTTPEGAVQPCTYKLALFTREGSGADAVTERVLQVTGNTCYKLIIGNVSAPGLATPEMAEQSGFSNDLEATVMITQDKMGEMREMYLRNGYQLGMDCANWVYYDDNRIQAEPLGRLVCAAAADGLADYTVLDPNYPALGAPLAISRTGYAVAPVYTPQKLSLPLGGVQEFWYLSFTEEDGKQGTGYTLYPVIRLGVLQKELKIERHPAVASGYQVINLQHIYMGEVLADADGTKPGWLGFAEQRHEGATLGSELTSDNEYIFLHIRPNSQAVPRQASVRLFGQRGYEQVRLIQRAQGH